MYKIGVIGSGNIGQLLIRRLSKQTSFPIYFSAKTEESLKKIPQSNLVQASSNFQIQKECNLIFLAVKPSNFPDLNILPSTDSTFVSIMAGLQLDYLQKKLKTNQVIRIMPNLYNFMGHGLLPASSQINIPSVLNHFGSLLLIDDAQMDSMTAHHGCIPAILSELIQVLIKKNMKDTQLNSNIVEQMLFSNLERTILFLKTFPPETLENIVSSKGGMTEQILKNIREQVSFDSSFQVGYDRMDDLRKNI